MDQKPWLHRKRLIAVNSEAGISIKGNEGEKLRYNKEAVHSNSSLKNCKQQLRSLKVDKDHRVNLEHKRLESRYTETREKLANNLRVENGQLTKAFVNKEELTKSVSYQMSEATTEYHVLKRELKIRTLNAADVANQQHQETANLEAERQRLRLLVKKRVPGHEKTKSVDKRMSSMMKKLSEVEEENRRLKESLSERENEIRNLKGEMERNPESKILELENRIVSLELELERVNESMRTTEDQFDNLKLMTVDLDQQLSSSKVEIKEAFQKVSVLEMELEDKSQQYEGLETSCLELQLQLATVSSKNEVTEDAKQERKLIQTLTNNKNVSQRSSLCDSLNSLTIKEILITETKDASVSHYNICNRSCGLTNVVPQAWSIVPRVKRSKGIELIWKLLVRRKKGGKKKKKKKRRRLGTCHI